MDRAVWTLASHLEFSSLLSQRSMLWDPSPQASTTLIRLSCSALPLNTRGISSKPVSSCPGASLPLSLFSYTAHSLFHRSVKPLPAAVGRFGFEPPARHPGLLGLLAGARVDNVAFVRAVNHRLEEEFVLSAAPPVGAGQRLAAAHDHLRGCERLRSGPTRTLAPETTAVR